VNALTIHSDPLEAANVLELVTAQNHSLWELRGALFIHAESNYEIFIQAVKGYKSLGQ
jgi:hypothetical protein